MARHRHLPIWKSAFDLAVHLENAVRRFPRYHKYGLGQELRQCARRLCRLVAQANDARDAMRVLIEVGRCWLWPQHGTAPWHGPVRHYPGPGALRGVPPRRCARSAPALEAPGRGPCAGRAGRSLPQRLQTPGVAPGLAAAAAAVPATVSPAEHLSEILSETLSFDSARGFA